MLPNRNTMAGANPRFGTTVIIANERASIMKPSSELLTKRLRLRPPAETDAKRIFSRYGQDAEVCRYMCWTPHRSISDTLSFLRRIVCENNEGKSIGYLIFELKSGELLGSIGGAIERHKMQFGYCLARDAWGKGFATEAVGVFIETVMKDSSLWRLQAFCDVENRASARVLEKAGLTLEGTLRRYLVLPNLGDAPRDVFCFAKVRETADTDDV
jgi:RimJ/RimL family protein N-acetyltransferase